MIKGATFSEDRLNRFELHRIWDDTKPLIQFVGLNPSQANESKNDNTITKIIKISYYNGYGGLYMTNLFSFISTKPENLIVVNDHTENDKWLKAINDKCKSIVFCWGAFKVAKKRSKDVAEMFPAAYCIAHLKDGSPKHPLYCLDKSQLIPF